jgi:hypothetical protein
VRYPPTISRELTVLKRMFSRAIQSGRLVHKPHFPMLRENNVQAGFFEHEQYLAVPPHLPEPMRPVVRCEHLRFYQLLEIGAEFIASYRLIST